MTSDKPLTHTVKSSDETLTSVSSLYGISIEELLLINDINPGGALFIGQILNLDTSKLSTSLLFEQEDYGGDDDPPPTSPSP